MYLLLVLLSNTKGDFLMEGLTVKGVDLMGDTIMAAQDKNGNIWAGVSYFCKALA